MAENSGGQCSFAEALRRATTQLQMSDGAAETELVEACRSGKIRSYVRKSYGLDRIERSEWEPSPLRDIFVLMTVAKLSAEDLQYWLATRSNNSALISAPADDPEPLPSSRDTAEEACEKFIRALLALEPRPARHQISAKAHDAIRDLLPKEFDRAWRAVPLELKKAHGRPRKTNPHEKPPI